MTIKQANKKAGSLTVSKRVNLIMEHEGGDLTTEDTLILFANLIKTGMAWSLQGHCGRGATNIIQQGYINKAGEILKLN